MCVLHNMPVHIQYSTNNHNNKETQQTRRGRDRVWSTTKI